MVYNRDCLSKVFRSDGPATILAIATANPPNVIDQTSYADYFFKITDSQDKQQLKEKFHRICERTQIKKRHTVVTEDVVRQNPNLCSYTNSSFDVRQDIVVEEIPKLAAAAASKAIQEWSRPVAEITHLILSSTSAIDLPGADYRLARLLGLAPSVNRIMLYTTGCHSGGTLLRMAKDLAENNAQARVLVVAAEVTVPFFRGPDAAHFENLIGQAIFGDGAAALIIGSDPIPFVENPIFEILAASQMMLPECDDAVAGHLREIGLTMHLKSQLPSLVASNLEDCLLSVLKPLELPGLVAGDWNSLFWAVHPGGRAILDKVEEKLGLDDDKLRASRNVLNSYGNMMSPSVLFILDEIRKKSASEGKSTTGEGNHFGVLLGFGTGVTIETVLLKSINIE